MVRPALSATRATEVMDFVAKFAGQGITLSQIVKGTGINVASCHAILNALVEQGYVTRPTNAKTYQLGPALCALGTIAFASQPLLAHARDAAAQLSEALDIPTLVTGIIGEEIVGMVACDRPDGRSAGLAVAERMPLVPPIGASFVAWSGPQCIDAWLARASGHHDDEMLSYWRHSLTRIRERSFQVELRSPESTTLAARMEKMAAGSGAGWRSELAKFLSELGQHLRQPETIEPAAMYDLVLIAAPIFDRDGRCAYNLCLGGFGKLLAGAEIQQLGERLVSTSLQVMQAERSA